MKNYIEIRKEYTKLRKEIIHQTARLQEHGDFSLMQIAGWIVSQDISFGITEPHNQFYKGNHALYWLDKLVGEYFLETDTQLLVMEGYLEEMQVVVNFATLLDTIVMNENRSFIEYQNSLIF